MLDMQGYRFEPHKYHLIYYLNLFLYCEAIPCWRLSLLAEQQEETKIQNLENHVVAEQTSEGEKLGIYQG